VKVADLSHLAPYTRQDGTVARGKMGLTLKVYRCAAWPGCQ